jgi:hypothetical protein
MKFLIEILTLPEFWKMIFQWFNNGDKQGIKDAYKLARETRDPKHISDYVNRG